MYRAQSNAAAFMLVFWGFDAGDIIMSVWHASYRALDWCISIYTFFGQSWGWSLKLHNIMQHLCSISVQLSIPFQNSSLFGSYLKGFYNISETFALLLFRIEAAQWCAVGIIYVSLSFLWSEHLYISPFKGLYMYTYNSTAVISVTSQRTHDRVPYWHASRWCLFMRLS